MFGPSSVVAYTEVLATASSREDVAILDMCSSWVSHFPTSLRARQVSGLGMNAEELAENPVLTDYVVKDLNKEARLPYQDNTFDAVVNTVSIDYLNKPIQIMKEVWLLSANVMYGGLLPVA